MADQVRPARLAITEEAGAIVATTDALRLAIQRVPFRLEIGPATGSPLLSSSAAEAVAESTTGAGDAPAPAFTHWSARYHGLTFGVDGAQYGSYAATGRTIRWYALTRVEDWSWEGNTVRLRVATNDHQPRLARLTVEVLDDAVVRLATDLERSDGVFEVGWAATATEGEGFFGLGERFGRANRRGHEVVNWIEDSPFDLRPGHDWTYWPVPFFVSSRGYGVWLETTRRAVFRLGSERPDAWSASVDGAEFSAVFFYGPDPVDVVRRFTALTGRPPLPPVWTFGVWKTTLGGPAAVRAEARRLRQEQLGVSAVWIYDQLEPETNSGWGSAMGYRTGTYDHMDELIRELHADGYRVLGYVNPQFISERPVFAEGVEKGYFLRRGDGSTYVFRGIAPDPESAARPADVALFDPTNAAGVAWWQAMLRRLLVETGYDGWMQDFGELTPVDAVFADGRTGWEIRNLYPTLYHRAAAEVFRQVKPDGVFFVRSGYVGSNQWAPAAWPGDQHCDWSHDRGLPGVIPAGLSVGICGTNTWGPDIGGFFDASDGGASARSKELWIRWCQLGALTPIMRDHLGTKRVVTPDAVDLWTDEETIDAWRRCARLHNALVPYLYAYAAVAHDTGIPTMRHLVLRYPNDPEALQQDHEYLLGDELLVAPVVAPGVTTWRVYFPVGTWHSFWDDAVFEGPGYREVPAPLNRIPLFVRGGGILPLLADPVVTLANVTPDELLRRLEIRVYPQFRAATERRAFRFHDRSQVVMSGASGSFTLQFVDGAADRQHVVRLGPGHAIASVHCDGRPLARIAARASEPGWWDDSAGASYIRVPQGTRSVAVSCKP